MAEFFSNYGLWIVLAGVFFAMHWFGMGCCGSGHRHGAKSTEGAPDERAPTITTSSADGKAPVSQPKRSCH